MTIKITSATFSACVVGKDGLPDDQLPVVALVGRSNVGKSSLINCITGRKELARTSAMPGKTLTINYYCINEEFYIVDLPGYGYAKASKVTRQRIQTMMNEFFAESKNLKGVIQVLDIRHKPSPLDEQMQTWIKDQKINNIAVITKADKLSHQQVAKMQASIIKDLHIGFAMPFSAKSAAGKEEFLDAIEKIIAGLEVKNISGRSSRPQQQRGPNDRPRSGSRPQGARPEGGQAGARPARAPGSQPEKGRGPARRPDRQAEKQPDRPDRPDRQTDKQSEKPVARPAEKAPDQQSERTDNPAVTPESAPGQNRRRRWKNKKNRGNDDKTRQPQT